MINVIKIKKDESIKEIINKQYKGGPTFFEIELKTYYHVYINDMYGNCKVCTIHSMQTNIHCENIFDKLDELFNYFNKLCFFFTCNNYDVINIVSEHYKCIYVNEVPIGYSNITPQYHCLFFTKKYVSGKDTEAYIKKVKNNKVKLLVNGETL